jgi:hypothetical protein
MLSTHLSTVATIGDTVTAAVIAVAASIATLVATFSHLVSGKVASVAIGLDRDVRALMILASERDILMRERCRSQHQQHLGCIS